MQQQKHIPLKSEQNSCMKFEGDSYRLNHAEHLELDEIFRLNYNNALLLLEVQ